MNKGAIVIMCAVGALGIGVGIWSVDFWLTPDQQGAWLSQRGMYVESAQRYRDPLRAGIAWYRAGEFKEAGRKFAQVNSATGRFNHGNALVMQGKYTEAVEAYEAALEQQPGWKAAEENRELAQLRAERVKREGGDMTGGKLGADDIVFSSGKQKEGGGEEEVMAEDQQTSDAALQALWLRRVQTKPADFLRAKFAYQAQQGATE